MTKAFLTLAALTGLLAVAVPEPAIYSGTGLLGGMVLCLIAIAGISWFLDLRDQPERGTRRRIQLIIGPPLTALVLFVGLSSVWGGINTTHTTGIVASKREGGGRSITHYITLYPSGEWHASGNVYNAVRPGDEVDCLTTQPLIVSHELYRCEILKRR